jgi:lipooligosaccharide transport system permease protein
VQRNALVYRRRWRGSLFTSFLQPTLFLTAMGVMLGSRIDQNAPVQNGVPFVHFLAPGLLAAACMQTATFESSFPVHNKLMWQRTYHAISATPVGIPNIVIGELAWIGLRLVMVAATFAVVMAAFGVLHSPWALLAIPAAVLTGLAFSAPIIAYAATLASAGNFNVLFRFVITPLFLFSGVFFPVDRLPGWLERAAWLTPLFHGVSLTRGLTLGTLESSGWTIHVLYLVLMLVGGASAAVRTFDRKLRA